MQAWYELTERLFLQTDQEKQLAKAIRKEDKRKQQILSQNGEDEFDQAVLREKRWLAVFCFQTHISAAFW